MVANKGNVTFTLPSCIEDGQYLMRHEIIGWFPNNNISRMNSYAPDFQLYILHITTPVLSSTCDPLPSPHSRHLNDLHSRWNALNFRSPAEALFLPPLSPSLALIPGGKFTLNCIRNCSSCTHYSDPGILINIYDPITSYTIPGPPLFTCWILFGDAVTRTLYLNSTQGRVS